MLTSYNFSYDDEAYYLRRQKGNEMPVALVLPVCRATIDLFQAHKHNMHALAQRLRTDKNTGDLLIQGFKQPHVDITENKQHILPLISRLQ